MSNFGQAGSGDQCDIWLCAAASINFDSLVNTLLLCCCTGSDHDIEKQFVNDHTHNPRDSVIHSGRVCAVAAYDDVHRPPFRMHLL
eukprot:7022-Heterococcus_DN1.PRE.1